VLNPIIYHPPNIPINHNAISCFKCKENYDITNNSRERGSYISYNIIIRLPQLRTVYGEDLLFFMTFYGSDEFKQEHYIIIYAFYSAHFTTITLYNIYVLCYRQ